MASQTAPAAPGAHEVATHGDVTSTHEGAEGHGGGGLPQLQMEHWGGQIAWLLLIFVVLYVLLSRVFLPRLRAVQDERAETISSAVQAARSVQDEADRQAESARQEVQSARAEARATAAEASARVAAETKARQAAEEAAVNARIAEAETAIRKTRDAAMANVSTIAGDAAGAMIERLTGKPATAAEISAAIKGAG